MERLRGEPEMVDTANERGSEGTAKGGERERKKEREREIIQILYKTVTSFQLLSSYHPPGLRQRQFQRKVPDQLLCWQQS